MGAMAESKLAYYGNAIELFMPGSDLAPVGCARSLDGLVTVIDSDVIQWADVEIVSLAPVIPCALHTSWLQIKRTTARLSEIEPAQRYRLATIVLKPSSLS